MKRIKLGLAPTRRSIFSAPDAVKYRKLTADKLSEMGISFVDITDINEEGLLFDESDRLKITEKFKKEKIDGLFLPHCNFGTEYECARLAKEMNVPVLLWGPLDERPEPDGTRLRDSQCGLFATGKVLRRFQVPFTYLTNCRLEDPVFERGIRDFVAVCNTVKVFRQIRILQISTRPFDFWSTMCNEGELLERFNIQLAPVPMTELMEEIREVRKSREQEIQSVVSYLQENTEIQIEPKAVYAIAALKTAMKQLIEKYGCNAAAIQCWNALQQEIGIMPCAANALLNEEGIPVACETDIHGAITSLLAEAAAMGQRSFFADWTIRHPDIANGELLQHCGPWPVSLAREKVKLTYPLAFKYPGSFKAEAKHGEITLCRFDGDQGKYSLLLGKARGVDGPKCMGTYLWIEVENIKRLEAKLVEGPYIHHCVGVHKDIVPILYEACKYIGIQPDLYDPVEDEVKAYLRGE